MAPSNAEGAQKLADLVSPAAVAEFAGDIKATMSRPRTCSTLCRPSPVRTIDTLREAEKLPDFIAVSRVNDMTIKKIIVLGDGHHLHQTVARMKGNHG
ncbi:MAG: hypothetical protein ACLTDO_03815 [Bifidobacterium pseudocatenulatum]